MSYARPFSELPSSVPKTVSTDWSSDWLVRAIACNSHSRSACIICSSGLLSQGFSGSAQSCSRKCSQRLCQVCSGVPAFASPKAAQYKRSTCCSCRCAVDSVNEMSGVQVPYDPHLPFLFFGEETSMAARLYTNGWDFFAPTQAVVYHLWTREYRHTFTEDLLKPEVMPQREASQARVSRACADGPKVAEQCGHRYASCSAQGRA